MRALFPDLPKALVPVAGRPFLAWQTEWLFRNNISCALLAAGRLGEMIETWAGQQPFHKRLKVLIEPAPLGTGGAIKHALPAAGKTPFWVLNGDSLLPELDFGGMEKAHCQSGALATIAVTAIEDSGRYGAVLFDGNGKIIRFEEKKSRQAGWINAGVYLMDPAVFSVIGAGKNTSIENEIFPRLAAGGKIFVFQTNPPLLDMGTPEGLENMAAYLAEKRP